MFPDLRYAGAINAEPAFKSIVIDGALAQNGMVSFAKGLTPADAEAIRGYLVQRAIDAKAAARGAATAATPPASTRPHQ